MSNPYRLPRAFFPARLLAVVALCACGASATGIAWADAADAHISPPRDVRYPGTVQLAVDASDTRQGIFRVHEVLSVRSGKLTLLYSEWIPGNHSPTGPIAMLAGLTITANGRRLEWTRDEFYVYAFHVEVPRDVSSLDVDFQYLSGRNGVQRIQMTDNMLSLEWHDVSLYPAGYYSRDITFAPSVTLPHGWQFGTPLETLARSGDTTTFKPVTYNTLIDSPMYAGLYFERTDLDPGAAVPVHLDVVADAPKYLQMTPEQLQLHRNLVAQAYRLFGSHHYDHYDFLFSLSDQLTARSGMWRAEQFREGLALVAANYDRNRPGFEWRTIEDTTNDPTAAHRQPLPYRSWQMSEEYYSAGQMLWLEVDAKIRSLTDDRKSLDTFASRFFGVGNGSFVTRTYRFDDVVAGLSGVVRYDWAGFLRQRLDAHQPPLAGIEASGWKLVYDDQESDFQKQYDSGAASRHMISFTFSIGLTLTNTGEIDDVRWNGPAFKAGVSTGATLVAVNGHAFSPGALTDAIVAAEHGSEPIRLLLNYQGGYATIAVDYHDGLQYPHLVRVSGSPDYLDEIIAPKK
jgi:predicted metalloprotease with PDZ domain